MVKKQNIYVIWNNDAYAEILKKNESITLVTNSTELNNVFTSRNDFSGIVILGELRWGEAINSGYRLSEMQGIEFTKRIIRAKLKIKLPILFVSFLPLSRILRTSKDTNIRDPQREILTSVGHDFLQLPSTPEQWLQKLGSMNPLTDLQLADIITNFCNIRGLIDEVIHRIQGSFRQFINSPKDVDWNNIKGKLRHGLLEIAAILPTGSLNAQKINDILDRFKQECEAPNKTAETINFVQRIGEELKSLINDENLGVGETKPTSKEKMPWRVLLLDDEPESNNIKLIKDTLTQRGVETVLISHIDKAEKAIEDDKNNEIVVAIADYRLNEDVNGIRRHQPKQGYDFLFDVSKKDRLTSLIALSGLSRRFLLESFRKYNTRVAVYSKNDLQTQEAINLFIDSVVELGNETYEALCSLPSSAAGWKALKPFYIAYRNSHSYSKWEREISYQAKQYVMIIESILKGGNQELIQNPPLPKIGNLRARIKDPSNEKAIKVFLAKLTARRIALWLNYCEGFNAVGIFGALTGTLDVSNLKQEKGNSKIENNAKNLINTNLALLLEEFPHGILVEEKRWFKYDMGIDIYNLQELLSQVSYHIQLGIEVLLKSNQKMLKELGTKTDAIDNNGHCTIVSFEEAKRILKMISELNLDNAQKDAFNSALSDIIKHISADKYADPFLESFKSYVRDVLGVSLKA